MTPREVGPAVEGDREIPCRHFMATQAIVTDSIPLVCSSCVRARLEDDVRVLREALERLVAASDEHDGSHKTGRVLADSTRLARAALKATQGGGGA